MVTIYLVQSSYKTTLLIKQLNYSYDALQKTVVIHTYNFKVKGRLQNKPLHLNTFWIHDEYKTLSNS